MKRRLVMTFVLSTVLLFHLAGLAGAKTVLSLTDWVVDSANTRGDWELVRQGAFRLINYDEAYNPTNAYAEIEQRGKQLIYEWSVEFTSQLAENNGVGLHVLATRPRPSAGTNFGGDSYLVLQRRDVMVLFKFVNGDIAHAKTLGNFAAQEGDIHSYRLEVNTETGTLMIYRNGELVERWEDPSTPHQSGAYVAVRTNRASAIYTDIRMITQD